jgi:prepilin-type N-terminal cleavage/methylation domain-containing protein
MRRSRSSGFTLVELLVVVGIIGLLAAISIIYYQGALIRTKQKRTMADMKSIAMAWEARAVDVKAYNAAGFVVPAENVAYTQMRGLLSPTYMKILPQFDAFGHTLVFSASYPVGSDTAATEYAIRSPGRDGILDSSYTAGPNKDDNVDIVYSGGTFIVWPSHASQ